MSNQKQQFGWGTVVMFIVAGLVAYVIYAGATAVANARDQADHIVCVRIEALKKGFVDSLERAKAEINGIAYYKTHPAERQKAIDEINRQIRLYAPADCP